MAVQTYQRRERITAVQWQPAMDLSYVKPFVMAGTARRYLGVTRGMYVEEVWPGCWIVTDRLGDRWVKDDAVFRAQYEQTIAD